MIMTGTCFSKRLKIVLLGIAVCGILIYAFAIPQAGLTLIARYPEFSFWYVPWIVLLSLSGIPCYIALFLMWKITQSIQNGRAFTYQNATRLKRIALLAQIDAVFFVLGNLLFLLLGMNHPSVVLGSVGIAFVGEAIAVACKALSVLTQKAADLQEQSDLTI